MSELLDRNTETVVLRKDTAGVYSEPYCVSVDEGAVGRLVVNAYLVCPATAPPAGHWCDQLTEDSQNMLVLADTTLCLFGYEPQYRHLHALVEIAALLDELAEPILGVPWDRDIIGELVRNADCPGILANGWWQRGENQIDKVTIHHTYGWHDVHAFARSYVQKGGGRPSVPYTIWVTSTGEVLLLNALTEGCWHDHTGHENTHLSVGLAGSLHLHRPPTSQLISAAKVCKWAIDEIPGVLDINDITGHDDWYPTACPGWTDEGESAPSGEWESFFFGLLGEML